MWSFVVVRPLRFFVRLSRCQQCVCGFVPRSKRKIRIQTLNCQMKHGRRGPTDKRFNIYVHLNINTLSHKTLQSVSFFIIDLQHISVAFCLFGAEQLPNLFFCHAYITKYLHDMLPIRCLKLWNLYFLLADNTLKKDSWAFLNQVTKYQQAGW